MTYVFSLGRTARGVDCSRAVDGRAHTRSPSSTLGGSLMARTTRTVVVALAVRVPVNASGSLVDGATRIVERSNAVDRADSLELVGLEPGLNDTVVDVQGHLRTTVGERGEDLAVLRRQLEGTVGVRRVYELEAVDADEPALEEVVLAGSG